MLLDRLLQLPLGQALDQPVDCEDDIRAGEGRQLAAIAEADLVAQSVALEGQRATGAADDRLQVRFQPREPNVVSSHEADEGRGQVALRVDPDAAAQQAHAAQAQLSDLPHLLVAEAAGDRDLVNTGALYGGQHLWGVAVSRGGDGGGGLAGHRGVSPGFRLDHDVERLLAAGQRVAVPVQQGAPASGHRLLRLVDAACLGGVAIVVQDLQLHQAGGEGQGGQGDDRHDRPQTPVQPPLVRRQSTTPLP